MTIGLRLFYRRVDEGVVDPEADEVNHARRMGASRDGLVQ
jgi:hypothetical protein